MNRQPTQVQKHLMTFSITVDATSKKINQSLDYHHKILVIHTHKFINVKPLKSRNTNTKFDVEVPVLPETAAHIKTEAEQIALIIS